MARCDMCGTETNLVVATIEGTEMNVCNECGKFGKVIRRIQEPRQAPSPIMKKQPEEEKVERVVGGYGKQIKESREKKGLTQEEFAKKINEKVSLIHKIESEHQVPSISLAQKIGKFLGIVLIEQEKPQEGNFSKSTSDALTIGDLIKLKKS